jgi:hypothetical protein
VPDALSRKSAHDSDFAALTACTPQWIQEVVTGYQDDSHASSVLAKLMLDDQAVPKFSLHNCHDPNFKSTGLKIKQHHHEHHPSIMEHHMHLITC